MKLLSTHKELVELLKRPEYKFEMPERHYIEEYEKCNFAAPFKAMTLFDDMLEETGRVPEPQEYLDRTIQMTKENFYHNSPEGKLYLNKGTKGRGISTNYLQWSDSMEKAVRWRAGRTYRSMLAEYSALLHFKDVFPNSLILAGDLMDFVAGVDITILDRDLNISIQAHITKESPWAEKNISDKLTRTSGRYGYGGRYYPWEREWSDAHIIVAYNENPSPFPTNEIQSSMNVNGNILFKEEFIRDLSAQAVKQTDETFMNNGMVRFDNYLKKYGISKQGARGLIIYEEGKANFVSM